MSDTASTPTPHKDRSCTRPFGIMRQACIAWYRRLVSRSEKETTRPSSDSTLVAGVGHDEFSMKMGAMPADCPGIIKAQPRRPPQAVTHMQRTPQVYCKYSSEFDRRTWGELQPQVVPDDMVLERIKASPMDSSPLRGGVAVAAHG